MLFRAWWDRRRFLTPIWRSGIKMLESRELLYDELKDVEKAGGPNLEPYEGLSNIWDDYAKFWMPN
jgi:hypothetical protein